jgi:glycine/D-amino acid oxidase-like deaminating enzyme
LHEHEEVISWRADDRHVEVVTKRDRYAAQRLVITAGAWATRFLADIGVPFSVIRQTPLWFAVSRPELFRRDRFPCYCVDTPEGFFYGFPMIDSRGIKVARHYGADELCDPSAVNWQIHGDDEASPHRFLQAHLPRVDGAVTHGSVCMYTLTLDRHFVIDLHPRHANVAVAAGFSGHGFKFASVVGEILADLCEHGTSTLPIEMFSASRFGR